MVEHLVYCEAGFDLGYLHKSFALLGNEAKVYLITFKGKLKNVMRTDNCPKKYSKLNLLLHKVTFMPLNIGDNIKRIREAKGLSQKELITAIGMGAPMYSRIETGKTEPSLSSLEKIAKALGIKLSELFSDKEPEEVNSHNTTLMEKVRLIESLTEEEQKTLFTILDAFVGKKKLKDTLSSVLKNVA
jgi:transcriptional regulator with XRE-family HTH domain